jgi:arylsulfatase A-like enzyme
MNSKISRRDFLRVAGLLPLGFAAPRWARALSGASGQQNVVIVVFDAFSAYNISLYGYQRETTPSLNRLSKRAVVYHNHYAGSNFTTSGTASLLTGTVPWTHRAIKGDGEVAPRFVERTFFAAFDDYYRLAYTHNPWAFTLLDQFAAQIDDLIPKQKLYLRSYDSFLYDFFNTDEDIASVSWARNVGIEDSYAYSLFMSHLDKVLREKEYARVRGDYPLGLPLLANGTPYLLGQAIDWIANRLHVISQPFFGYFHFLPPHAPYRPPAEFVRRFVGDGYQPLEKPLDVFAADQIHKPALTSRMQYDQFILHVDAEFGRFYDQLERSGLLDNTWLILTSDHGEMFERGILGHGSDALYEPLMRIPLTIFEPGRQQGMDVRSLTSAVDLLPTLARLTGHAIPSWAEGTLLPPYDSAEPDAGRSIYAARATRNKPDAPLTVASTMLLKGSHKLHYYFGYPALHRTEKVQLYDVANDPEEMMDLASAEKDIAAALLRELKAKIADVNKPYE